MCALMVGEHFPNRKVTLTVPPFGFGSPPFTETRQGKKRCHTLSPKYDKTDPQCKSAESLSVSSQVESVAFRLPFDILPASMELVFATILFLLRYNPVQRPLWLPVFLPKRLT